MTLSGITFRVFTVMEEMSSSFSFCTVWLQEPESVKKKKTTHTNGFVHSHHQSQHRKTWCVCVRLVQTFRYEKSSVVEVREGLSAALSFLVAFLTDDQSREGAIDRVTGNLGTRRQPFSAHRGRWLLIMLHKEDMSPANNN